MDSCAQWELRRANLSVLYRICKTHNLKGGLIMKFHIHVCVMGLLAASALGQQICPTNAVFLALENEIRGYPLRANGPATPCQVIKGSNSTLETARSIAFDKHNSFHIAQFLTDATFDIFPPNAFGNATPSRTVSFPLNDLASIAVDSRLNDFVISINNPALPIFVAPNGSRGILGNPVVISDPNIQLFVSLAIDLDDNLLVGGYDANGDARIDTLNTSHSITSPSVVRSIFGPDTGLFDGGTAFANNNLTIALDPQTNELFVYNATADQTRAQVSVFARRVNGNAKPLRVISGQKTTITGPGIIGANKIGVSSDGRLFVAEPNNRILVFAPGAAGNVSPSQVIHDTTTGTGPVDQGGIGVRSCSCD
jgi:hypothetical protein